jgi:hypothetical protein
MVARARRHRRTNAERLALAVSLLQDPVFDVFLTGSSTFAELPGVVQRLADGNLDALCHVIEYPSWDAQSADQPTEFKSADQPTEATR